ncbi:hypothetical protein NDU88_000093 [Pleurodeles waltl]|uniref:Uncharacterized protein n=1 Tax=Pleurodeles waltl TaxID=8319 RepID=A0AAV7VWE2_PLEWA|nr:hypothetical protein NDU88_000093 [Pleurodeles waltl]
METRRAGVVSVQAWLVLRIPDSWKSKCVADRLSHLPLSAGSVEEVDDGECEVAFTHEDVMFLQNGEMDGEISECVWMKEIQKDDILLKVRDFILKGWPSKRSLQGERCVSRGSNVDLHSIYLIRESGEVEGSEGGSRADGSPEEELRTSTPVMN